MVPLYYTDEFVLPLEDGHFFPMSRYRRLRERITSDQIVPSSWLLVPDPASNEELELVHDSGYVRRVVTGMLDRDAMRRIGFPWSQEMVERSRRSVGATVEAARAAFRHGAAVNLAGGTHHAHCDRGGGYCVFNDVAVAVRLLQRQRPDLRVAVVDLDAHQGDGTAALFEGDPSVFTLSLHTANGFPRRKTRSDLDVPLADRCGDDEYLERLEGALGVCRQSIDPGIVFYLAGADPYEGDRIGRLGLTKSGLVARDRLVLEAGRDWGCPMVATMAGGYARDVEDVVDIQAATVSAIVAERTHSPS